MWHCNNSIVTITSSIFLSLSFPHIRVLIMYSPSSTFLSFSDNPCSLISTLLPHCETVRTQYCFYVFYTLWHVCLSVGRGFSYEVCNTHHHWAIVLLIVIDISILISIVILIPAVIPVPIVILCYFSSYC
jgi:hypothetical protein